MHYLHSISEGKGNNYTGLCVFIKKKNSLHSRIDLLTRVAGFRVLLKIKRYSPYLAKFSLNKRGAGNLNKKLYYVFETNKENKTFTTPITNKSRKRRINDPRTNLLKKSKKSKVILDDTRF